MTYSDILQLPTYDERLESLMLYAQRFEKTFGSDRWLNQVLYQSNEWRHFRDRIIERDGGCDLAIPGLPISGRIYVHHIVPLTIADVDGRSSKIFDPENVICMSYDTHNRVHYHKKINKTEYTERCPNDTCPWKQNI